MIINKKIAFISFFITLGFLLTQLSGSLFAPVLPQAAKIFNVSPQAVKYIISIYFGGYAIGQLVWGSCSDHFGRKRMAIISTVLYLCCAILAMFWRHIIFFYINYAVIGFAAANYTSVGNAMLKDLYPPEQLTRVIAFIGVVMGVGPLLGAVIGTNLVEYLGWDSLFLFLIVIAFVVLIGMLFVVPETLIKHAVVQQESFFYKVKLVLSNKVFQRSVIFLALAFGTFTAYLATAAFLFKNVLHISDYMAGWLLAFPACSYVVGALIVMLIIKNNNPWQLLRPCGISLFAISIVFVFLAAFNLANSVVYIIMLMLAMLLIGMLVPLGKSGCMTAMQYSGGITASLMKLIQSVAATLMSFAFAAVSSASFLPFAILMLMVTCAMVITSLVFNRFNC
jgi:DHA1 family bicyclomycin/chloramphenicol resistance-like MFS transporter